MAGMLAPQPGNAPVAAGTPLRRDPSTPRRLRRRCAQDDETPPCHPERRARQLCRPERRAQGARSRRTPPAAGAFDEGGVPWPGCSRPNRETPPSPQALPSGEILRLRAACGAAALRMTKRPPCHPERRRRSRRSRRIPLAALRPQRAHEPQATPDQKRLVQVSCGWPRAERARAPAGARRGADPPEPSAFPCIFLRVLYGRGTRSGAHVPAAPDPALGAGGVLGTTQASDLRKRAVPSRGVGAGPFPAAVAGDSSTADRCPRRAKVPKACTAPPAELPWKYKSPKKVHRPAAARGQTRRGARAAPRRSHRAPPRCDASGPDRHPMPRRGREVAHFSRFVARASAKRLFAHIF